MQQIQAVRFDVQQIGKHVKGSKKRYTWQVNLKNKFHTIVLDFSFISGKVKIAVDRKIFLQNQLPSNVSFQYPFTLDGFALNVIQQGQTFELRINNKVFSHLYNQTKTNKEFKKYQDQIKDIKVDSGKFSAEEGKKVSLNMGAFGGMKKKKEAANQESSGWNAFAGQSQGFPSYFGNQPAQKQEKAFKKPQKSLLDEDEETTSTDPFNSPQKTQQKPQQQQQLMNFTSEPQPTIQSPNQQQLSTLSQGQQPQKKRQEDEFNTMQNMFMTMNVNVGENTKEQDNEVDFFAQNKSPTSPPPAMPQQQQKQKDFNEMFKSSPSNIDKNSFATGFQNKGDISGTSMFATTNFNNPSSSTSSFSFDEFKNTTSSPSSQFSKKTNPEPPTNFNLEPTNFNLNTNTNPSNINLNDYNTMQNLFMTGNLNQTGQPQNIPTSVNINLTQVNQGLQTTQFSQQTKPSQQQQLNSFSMQPQQQPQPPVNNTSATTDIPMQFNTMQGLFMTNSNINETVQSEQLNFDAFSPPKKTEAKNVPTFANNNPSNFASMSGGNVNFDINSFATLQAGHNKPLDNLDFLGSNPKKTQNTNAQNDLI